MSAKQRFLDELRTGLRKYPSGEVDDYIDYYDELISERVANGEEEAAALKQVGTSKDVAASFKKENAINRAVKKPTVSNGLKALIAVLSVLSLPLLVPALIVVIALLITCAVLFVAGLVVLISGAIVAIASVVDMTSIVFTGDAPVYLLFLVAGAALTVMFVDFELTRGLLSLGRWFIRTLIRKIKIRHGNRKLKTRNVVTEEQ